MQPTAEHQDRPHGGHPDPLGRQTGRMRLRGLMPEDRPLHTAHLLRLTAADRRARFNTAVSDSALIAYSRGLDWRHIWVFGAFIDGVLRGVGELIPLAGTNDAEAAISVEHAYQHEGIGKALMLSLYLVARRNGTSRLHIAYEPENRGMRGLARDLGGVASDDAGFLESIIDIPSKRAMRA